jgi:hypothetical protein
MFASRKPAWRRHDRDAGTGDAQASSGGRQIGARNARHAAKGDLHGITVVVDTTGAELYIGRFFEQRGDGIVLLDVARHSDGANGVSKEQYVQTAARFGQWKELQQVVVPLPEVRSVTRLADAGA